MSNVPVSLATLTTKRFTKRVVTIPDVGDVVVRAISRAEALTLGVMPGQVVEIDLAVAEQKLLSAAMVSPKMTVDDVAEWQRNSPASEINVVFMAVTELSGMAAGAPKDAVKRFPPG